MTRGLRAAEEKMRADGAGQVAIATFSDAYEKLAAGDTGLLPEREIAPVADLPHLDDLPEAGEAGTKALAATVVLKLNGGLGTSMGLAAAKSLLEVKAGRTFLDLIVAQTLTARTRFGARLPLVLMDSFRTRDDSLAALRAHPDIEADVPLDFLQNREPKLRADDLTPVSWPDDPSLEWCPPGHGDVYAALATSGMLDTLLERGYAHAFLSNADNLGAVVEPRILAWMAAEGVPFVSEQCARGPSDRKGGHLARRRDDGRLVLRETAQTPGEDQAAFEDPHRHPYFNCNNIWVDLRALRDTLRERDGVLGLPLIRNDKTVDPSEPSSPAVIQLETAMGAAISVWEDARAVVVSRERFLPVKTTNDLLGVRSDAHVVAEDGKVAVSPERTVGPLVVDLDPHVYKLLAPFEQRFPAGPPSLVACERFAVRGDASFGRGVVARGRVEVKGPAEIADGAVLEG